ncbi:MAG: hypothetical protein M1140_16945 [Chloroflexi bacterium]|nr:hypothetical protein [Chloroflexota bacterium]
MSSTGELLNQLQRNSLSIGLREMEITLRHATEDLTSREQGMLYENKPTISPQALEQFQREVALALQDVADLVERLDLSRSAQSNTAVLLAQMAVLWSNLCDISVDKLSRYGDVSPDLAALLMPALTRLIEHTQTMMHILGEAGEITQESMAQGPSGLRDGRRGVCIAAAARTRHCGRPGACGTPQHRLRRPGSG